MVVIVSVSKLHNGKIQVAVAKPQHNSKPVQSYVSEKEVREVLLALGVAGETADNYLLKLFPQLSQELTFPPIDVPQPCEHKRPRVAQEGRAGFVRCYWSVLDTEEKALLAFEPTRRMVPTTNTKITASITAYSAISCPLSSLRIRGRKRICSATPFNCQRFCPRSGTLSIKEAGCGNRLRMWHPADLNMSGA